MTGFRVKELLVATVVGLTSLASAEPRIHCDGQDHKLRIYLEMYNTLFMERDTSRVAEFYADEFISHNNDRGEGAGYRLVTPADMAARWDRSKALNPDRVLEDELILCVDDFVVVRTLVKTKFVAPLAGVEPTGDAYEYTATDIYRFENGKVVERWGNNDMASAYKQLGFRISRD